MSSSRFLIAFLGVSLLAGASGAQDLVEPGSGVSFPLKRDGATLLGAALRIKKILFVKAKVYAVALYVGDEALSGPLEAHRGKTTTQAFFKDLVWGDFRKEVVLHFVRDVGQSRIQEAMREALQGQDKGPLDTFVSYFPEVKTGQECVLAWGPGGSLEVSQGGKARPPIADKAFAAAVFALYLGEHPLQEEFPSSLVTRAKDVLP